MKSKKIALVLVIVFCITAIFGCTQKEKESFDFKRYYGETIDIFCEDFGLTEEDWIKDSDNYRSKELLPFLTYEATYILMPDEEGKTTWIDVVLEEDLEKAETLYDIALEICEFYDGMKDARYYFDSFDGEPVPKKETDMDENGEEVEFTDYRGVYSKSDDIKQYPSYSDLKNADMEGAVGIWNLDDSVQMSMMYKEVSLMKKAMIRIRFMDSEDKFATMFGDADL